MAFISVIVMWLYVYLSDRLKKFNVDEDEESLSNMDTQCEAKPSSNLNQGNGSHLSDYISSPEQGGGLDLFSLYSFITFFLAVADKATQILFKCS